ncbi:uncharacterized protein LOC135494486 [Lineus longissimus]|uniref:uncharacterized protein LOC135494486 n=1 Tax=Lineus longissimus TaxID=88925 RepID=UPI00315D8989
MAVILRPATDKDLSSFNKWMAKLGWAYSTDLKYQQACASSFDVTVAEVDGEAAGIAVWAKVTDNLFQLTDLVVDEQVRGKGVGKRLVENPPEFTKGKNRWLNAVESALDFYPKFGYTIQAEGEYSHIRGHPKVTSEATKVKANDATNDVTITDVGQTSFTEFLRYERSVINNLHKEMESLMKSVADSGTVILAKHAGKTVGVALQRFDESTKICRLVLFADSSDVAIKIISFITLNHLKDHELLLTVPMLTSNTRALAEYFDLEIVRFGRAMFNLRDAFKTDVDIEKVYSYIPI